MDGELSVRASASSGYSGWACSLLLLRPLLLFFWIQMHHTAHAVDMWWNLGVKGVEVWRNHELYVVVGLQQKHQRPICQLVRGLSPGQTKFCQMYEDHMLSISRGAQMGIRECQWQFRSRRWNCSVVEDSSVFGHVLDQATRETAFVHAILSAGVTHAVSRACRDGELTTCGCSRRPRPRSLQSSWLWGGCGDDSDYGYRFAMGFIDVREKEKNFPRHSRELARMLVNLHNNEAGRRAVANHVRPECKCHGVSGSCSLRTCWHQLPTFRETGDRVRDRYDAATEMRFNVQGTKLVQAQRRFNRATKEDLIHIDQSHDFCDADPAAGSVGTRGRQCNRLSQGVDGCNLMCCGRGYKTFKNEMNDRCRCKFHWCCYVKCETCPRTTDVYRCK